MKKKALTHLIAVVAMLAVACAYLAPALQGKAIRQGDIQKSEAMSYSQRMEKKNTGSIPNWNSSMFSGMPGYQIVSEPEHSVFWPLRNLSIMRPLGLERNIGVLFLYLIGFYLALLAFGLSPWLALGGAVAFGLGSYNLIIIEAGHITKAWAMSMMAPILGGLALVLRSAIDGGLEKSVRKRRVLWGCLLFTLSLILQISFNHIQITYYTAVACVVAASVYMVYALVRRRFKSFALKAALLVAGALLAFGSNARLLLVNEEYARYTMRGGSELTVTPADLYGEAAATTQQNTTDGLDIDYAFSWSYGIGETYTVLVPGAFGGGSGEHVGKDSQFYRNFRSEQAPLYWGEQPFTSGPVYFGAVVLLLALVGFVVCKGPERWWIAIAALLAAMMSWGSNFMGLNGWLFEHAPFYNKFRTPSMALVLSQVCLVIMASLALSAVMRKERDRRRVNIAIYVATGVLCVLIAGVLLLSGSFSFSGVADRQMQAQYGDQWPAIFNVLLADRMALLKSDSLRSVVFILLAAAVLWLYNNDKLRSNTAVVAAVSLLVLVDLWGVGRRYLNNDNFVEPRQLELRRDQWDYAIDEQAALYGDHDFRVLNLAVNTYNDSKPSAFHDQIGGYSAAKLSRYQNLIDFYLSRQINPRVLAMLGTRYVVLQNGQVQRLPEAMQNCCFVSQVKGVRGADEEILALADFDPMTTAVVDLDQWGEALDGFEPVADSTARIELDPARPASSDLRRYRSHCSANQLAVFSEIFYSPDWRAYIDGKPAAYLRADYVLRAMVVPAGDHVIEFRNEAPRLHRLDRLTLCVSIFTLLAMVASVALVYGRNRKRQ